jgi:hypothetical protein
MIICNGNRMAVKIGSGKPLAVTSESEMDRILSNATAADNGRVYLYTGESGTYETGCYYVIKYT